MRVGLLVPLVGDTRVKLDGMANVQRGSVCWCNTNVQRGPRVGVILMYKGGSRVGLGEWYG